MKHERGFQYICNVCTHRNMHSITITSSKCFCVYVHCKHCLEHPCVYYIFLEVYTKWYFLFLSLLLLTLESLCICSWFGAPPGGHDVLLQLCLILPSAVCRDLAVPYLLEHHLCVDIVLWLFHEMVIMF